MACSVDFELTLTATIPNWNTDYFIYLITIKTEKCFELVYCMFQRQKDDIHSLLQSLFISDISLYKYSSVIYSRNTHEEFFGIVTP